MERELVAAARSGDDVAFARLIETEAPRVYRAVLAIVRKPEDAQEVIQDASIRAWRRLGALREDDRWPAWYRRIAVRQAIERAKAAGRRRVRETYIDAAVGHAGLDPSETWAERVDVMRALGRLAADDRAVLGLRFGADLEVPDVAEALGIPLGTAKSRLHRALGRLATALGDGNEE
jgi:RNA polymerase sigma-70 factor, ECF subfamily